MLEKEIIDDMQAVFLMVNLVIPTVLLGVPAVTIGFAKRDAWISALLATAAGIFIGRLISSIIEKFPGKTIFEVMEELLGRLFGKIAGALFAWWILHTCSGIAREYGEFLEVAIMPDTPLIIFSVAAIIVSAYAVKSGFEVMARFNILFVLVIILFLLISALSYANARFDRMLPMFETRPQDVLKGALVPLAWMGEIVVFSVFSPALKANCSIRKINDVSVLLIGAFFLVGIMGVLLVFGAEHASAMMYPVYNQVRIISLANFLERLDYLIFMSWAIGGIIKIGIFYFALVIGISWLFGISDYRPIVFPVGIVIASLSMFIHEGVGDELRFLMGTFPFYSIIIFEVGIPLLLWLASIIKGRGHGA
ncbi:MAG: spore germination protein [Tepidanaerobacteraceae bacterium]|jgi:spore germination protein KB|nr:spore germination protein [Tepidanaerobacteraceae bacterium]